MADLLQVKIFVFTDYLKMQESLNHWLQKNGLATQNYVDMNISTLLIQNKDNKKELEVQYTVVIVYRKQND